MVDSALHATHNEDVREHRSLVANVWRRFSRNKIGLAGTAIFLMIAAAVIAAPLLTPYTPTELNLLNRFQPPSREHWMGTDDLGRDIWTRVLYGGRISLTVGLLSVLVSISVGTLVGLVSGYYGGWIDSILMRIADVFLSVPRLFVLIVLITLLRAWDLPWLRPGTFAPIALVIGCLSWMGVSRLIRASALEQRGREYTLAARVIGASDARILLLHILPNAASSAIVAATLGLAGAIISESGLSYLGFGVQLPTPTWGNMLSGTQNQMTTAPWTAIFPGLMIFIIVVAVNYMGDSLRDALDPHHVEKR
ncbi:MAG: ABC transporter permease [Anaerolineae bacterium]|nr:ABC transporter permease [Anaerolineae bacterium]